MTIPRDTVSLEDFERMERGLAPRKQKKEVKPEPEPPEVPNLKTIADIPSEEEIEDIGQRLVSHRNKDGVIFCGHDFYLKFRSGKEVEGWMDEANWVKVKKRISPERTDLLRKATA